jgi:hypothetical protein
MAIQMTIIPFHTFTAIAFMFISFILWQYVVYFKKYDGSGLKFLFITKWKAGSI